MQFRTMRRSRQLLSKEESEAVLKRGSHGVLACLGDGDYPYAVPLNYVYYEEKIFLHSAREGHKVDAILRHPKVCFTVVDEDTIVAAQYTSYFRSVIVFGQASVVEGLLWEKAFLAMADKYCASQPVAQRIEKTKACSQTLGIVIEIEHCTGKEAIEFVQAKTDTALVP
ncbi:MAG: pyridoxamine 5'-phosphate oxidase family protein [Sphaerochaeta sp.]|jgi:hypothetical protein|uniref:pyridoxamine 5'-phosphate oxidase family protein n=1 Tax=Sphaerochaeta sp. TaxID=1972642 RepID=UPI002607A96E|nr:pyridoxamine 5'-phosphate oxidase family protein [Sphaerochaeta sp.]MCK9598198.1 pyridoxamine 5'-phosphate oxidase family protein [Sphaerochaeta sp.]MDX9824844.1 pyridoxamine 5'-phosphate oxidase family protein [Sphaerochaeta sp.]NBK26063.1 5-nitroimidazole antibiotic resistance protein [Spirochaetia bacterium]HPE93606.1 pyridoxamine 5'-phosphate oxidase family protein [Sphaerochaeta sp.]